MFINLAKIRKTVHLISRIQIGKANLVPRAFLRGRFERGDGPGDNIDTIPESKQWAAVTIQSVVTKDPPQTCAPFAIRATCQGQRHTLQARPPTIRLELLSSKNCLPHSCPDKIQREYFICFFFFTNTKALKLSIKTWILVTVLFLGGNKLFYDIPLEEIKIYHLVHAW